MQHKKAWVAGLGLLLVGVLLGRYLHESGCCTGDTLTQIPDDSFLVQSHRVDVPPTTQQKIVCLTFDDGPSPVTEQILDTLREQGVHATFFVVAADNNRDYLPLVAREAAEGNQIGLHSCTHSYKKIYASPAAYWVDIKELRQQLEPYVEVMGIRWLRFPGGSTNTVSHHYGGRDIMKQLKAQATEKGYHYIDWNVCGEDAAGGHPDAATILHNIINDVGDKEICVVLLHDTAATKTTAQALPDIIAWFKAHGFEFCTVSEMAKLQEPPSN